MGDAAHSMVNHMAQGAATAIEDGAFLGGVIEEVVRGVISLEEAVGLYESKRMPRAWAKQQASFLVGSTYHFEKGSRQEVGCHAVIEGIANDSGSGCFVGKRVIRGTSWQIVEFGGLAEYNAPVRTLL
jgi:hypothetical protein